MKFTTPIRNSMAFDVAYNRFRSDNAFLPQPEVNLGDIARFDSVTSVQSVAYTPGTCTVGVCDGYYTTPLFREQVRTSLSIAKSRHDLKVGYEFVDITRDTRIWLISPFQANYQNGLPTSVNTYTLPVGDSTDPRESIDNLFSYHAREHGAYIQDKWALTRRIVVNLGLRYETNRSWQPASCAPRSDFFAGACYNEVQAPKFGDFAPRSSVVFDMFGDGRTVLKGTANRYNAPLGVDPLGRLNPISAPFDTRQWLPQSRCSDVIGGVPVTGCDRNGDLVPTLNELGTAPGYVFAGVNARYQDDLQRPVVNEYTVEFQRELPQGVVVVGRLREAPDPQQSRAAEYRRAAVGVDRPDHGHRGRERPDGSGVEPSERRQREPVLQLVRDRHRLQRRRPVGEQAFRPALVDAQRRDVRPRARGHAGRQPQRPEHS